MFRLVFLSFFMCSAAFAAEPLPVPKPVMEEEQGAVAGAVIPASKPLREESDQEVVPPEENIAAEDSEETPVVDGVTVLPPPLPDFRKKTVTAKETLARDASFPPRKPKVVNAVESQDQMPFTASPPSVFQNGDSRMAGQTSSLSHRELIQLKETQDQSPFSSDKLKTAGKVEADPIIIFFADGSSDLEVGQFHILEQDVLRPLIQSPKRRARIFGFAGSGNVLALSKARAEGVRDYLTARGIESNRLAIQVMGADSPIPLKNRVDVVME